MILLGYKERCPSLKNFVLYHHEVIYILLSTAYVVTSSFLCGLLIWESSLNMMQFKRNMMISFWYSLEILSFEPTPESKAWISLSCKSDSANYRVYCDFVSNVFVWHENIYYWRKLDMIDFRFIVIFSIPPISQLCR